MCRTPGGTRSSHHGIPKDSEGEDYCFVMYEPLTDPYACQVRCLDDGVRTAKALGFSLDVPNQHCICIWDGTLPPETHFTSHSIYLSTGSGTGPIHIEELEEGSVRTYTFNTSQTAYPTTTPTSITAYPTFAPTVGPTVDLQGDLPNYNCTYPNWGVNCNQTATQCSAGTCGEQ